MLGGAINASMLKYRNVLTPSGARTTETVALAQRFPQARIVFTGGSADLSPSTMREAEAARQFFKTMGLPAERATYETRSRNTNENATLTRALVSPKAGQRWLLVTSAAHMPRAIGAFRHAGFDVIAWPADYLTLGETAELVTPYSGVRGALMLLDIGAKEWTGLLAYRFTDRMTAVPRRQAIIRCGRRR